MGQEENSRLVEMLIEARDAFKQKSEYGILEDPIMHVPFDPELEQYVPMVAVAYGMAIGKDEAEFQRLTDKANLLATRGAAYNTIFRHPWNHRVQDYADMTLIRELGRVQTEGVDRYQYELTARLLDGAIVILNSRISHSKAEQPETHVTQADRISTHTDTT